MKWEERERSQNVEDRRGARMPMMVGGGMGLGGLLIMLVLLFLGADPRQARQVAEVVGGGGGAVQQQPAGPVEQTPEERQAFEFVSVILKDTEDVWERVFAQNKLPYRKPKMVVFSGRTNSGCGAADAGMGPFYCPADETVYIDLSFFQQMDSRKLGAPGDFARAYVIAHEVGHHVQKLLGRTSQVDEARQSGDEVLANQMSVRLELQADYLAGVWANLGQKEKQFLQKGDIEEALECAARIGDDFLQKQARGRVVKESFTHGTSQQRHRWFLKGIESGDIEGLDATFNLDYDDL